MVFPSFLMLGIREEGGRDPNERPDNQIHPKDTLEGVAVSLTSATAHPREGRAEHNQQECARAIPSLPDNSTANNV